MSQPGPFSDECVLTLDVDWATDPVIDHVAQMLVSAEVRATWFLTHSSPAIDRLRERADLFELGIHPNFLEGSSHGDSPEAVIAHCMSLVPDASSFRTHSLYQSTPILSLIMERTSLRTDVSLFLPRCSGLRPASYKRGTRKLLRVPFFWEDDAEMASADPVWELADLTRIPGLKVFDFHPIHIILNATDLPTYYRERGRLPGVGKLAEEDTARLTYSGPGPRSTFTGLLAHLSTRGGGRFIRDLGMET